MIALKNVLVATDFSPASDTALTYARGLAQAFGGRLHVLHVVQDVTAMSYADGGVALPPPVEWQADLERVSRESLDALITPQDRKDLEATTQLVTSNNTARAIVDCARESAVDLLVIGATGRGRVNRWLMGSVADKVIRQAPCPVLTIRHDQHDLVGGETEPRNPGKP